MINLRREKLRNLLQKEMEEYQYEIYSNNGSQYLLDKFTSFNNYNNKNKSRNEDNNNFNFFDNSNINGAYNAQLGNQNNLDLTKQNGQDIYMINKNLLNRQKYMESIQSNNINNEMENIGNNYYQNNQINSNNYGNYDLDAQINNYNSHYNKLRVDEFMSKKMIQDSLLNKINQKLMKINKDIDDKTYQENLAVQWPQNNQNA